ncbi:Techylectin-5B [Stylophora pistillata]|uniref:Techylectin-5B n=1 Tax=Stylophora pistillata TaxID=50429 RepID=A0A2B4R1K4_STYPI|nr:Techylectin-5B [Stylophora pistillata]
MHLGKFNLVCAAVYGISRLSEPDLRAVNFADKIEGQNLNGSLIKEIEVDTESSCLLECVDEERYYPRNCLDYYQNGSSTDGVYLICPDEEEPFQVVCDMTTDGGGWNTFPRPRDGSVDFYVHWESYKEGFGSLKSEFWIGNYCLYRLTASANIVFRIDMEDYEGHRRFSEYTTFSVADESDYYRVTIDGYRGTLGDSLSSIQSMTNMNFTTRDRDNELSDVGNCAEYFKGGWWYNSCHRANPNGLYQGGGHAQGVSWISLRGLDYSLKRTKIKLRPA